MIRLLLRLYVRLRFGKLHFVPKDRIDGLVCEQEAQNARGEVVGYWAYGSYDPSYPYRGQGE